MSGWTLISPEGTLHPILVERCFIFNLAEVRCTARAVVRRGGGGGGGGDVTQPGNDLSNKQGNQTSDSRPRRQTERLTGSL